LVHDLLVAMYSHKTSSDKTANADLAVSLTGQLPVSHASSILLISAVCIKSSVELLSIHYHYPFVRIMLGSQYRVL